LKYDRLIDYKPQDKRRSPGRFTGPACFIRGSDVIPNNLAKRSGTHYL
jgi:hypothetical protein